MIDKRFMVIHLGNAFDFVVKDLVENKTYGTFEGDGDSMKELCDDLDKLHKENQELYDFRFIYNALLFNIWHKYDEIEVYKSKRHHDGELCFDGEWFIVVAILPNGKQVTNHYPMKYWDYFKIPVYEKVKDKFDGHTSEVVFERLVELI